MEDSGSTHVQFEAECAGANHARKRPGQWLRCDLRRAAHLHCWRYRRHPGNARAQEHRCCLYSDEPALHDVAARGRRRGPRFPSQSSVSVPLSWVGPKGICGCAPGLGYRRTNSRLVRTVARKLLRGLLSVGRAVSGLAAVVVLADLLENLPGWMQLHLECLRERL